MGVRFRLEEPRLSPQVLDDQGVGVLHERPGRQGELVREFPGAVHRLHERQPLVLAQLVVLLAEGGGDVDDSGALLHGHEVRPHHPVGLLRVGQSVQGPISEPHQLSPPELPHHLGPLPQHGGKPRIGQDQPLAVMGHFHVGGIWVHRQGHVGRQGPGGGGPHQEGPLRGIGQGHEHEHGWVLHVAVPLGHLMGGEGGAAAGTVGQDLMALIKEPLLVDPLQLPPQGLDVLVLVGDVGMRKVYPEPHPPDHVLPSLDVLVHRGLASFYELLQPVAFDLGLGLDAEFLFHLQLHREAVAIPARLAPDEIAPHGLVAGEQVLVDAGQKVPEVGPAIGRGRALVEHVTRPPFPLVYGALERVVSLPELEHRLLPAARVTLQLVESHLLLLLP